MVEIKEVVFSRKCMSGPALGVADEKGKTILRAP